MNYLSTDISKFLSENLKKALLNFNKTKSHACFDNTINEIVNKMAYNIVFYKSSTFA